MAGTFNSDLHLDIKAFGGKDVDMCMNCGTCTSICPMSEDAGGGFPRRVIRLVQTGRQKRLEASLDPWLCYYCGDCTVNCPRDANPAEVMMASRRYLTARYDFTGLASLFYRSVWAELAAIGLVGLLVTGLFVFLHGPVVLNHVALNTFAPVKWVERGDWIMAAILSFFLLAGAARMAWWTLDGPAMRRISPAIYLRQVPAFFVQLFSQNRWRRCGTHRSVVRWMKHLLLVSGYLSMLTLVLILLRWFQTDHVYPFYYPQRLWGYYATAALLYPTGDFIVSRFRRKEPIHMFSEASDWIFLIMLFLTALTGILVNVFRVNGFPLATYVVYIIHLSIAVPMLVVEVPFSKWSHIMYRPLSIYLAGVKQAAAEGKLPAVRDAEPVAG